MTPEAEDRLEEAKRWELDGFFAEECVRGGYAIRRPAAFGSETWFFVNSLEETKSVLRQTEGK